MGIIPSESQKRIEEAKRLLAQSGYHVIPVESIKHLIAEIDVSDTFYFEAVNTDALIEHVHKELHRRFAYLIAVANVTDITQGKPDDRHGIIKFSARLIVIPAKVAEDPMLTMLREYNERKGKR